MFSEELKIQAEEIDIILNKFTFNKQYPQILYESMEYSLFSSAKRIRPILLMQSCKAVNGNMASCEPLVAAVEMIHTYSLIHDDLPCMDNDDFRRGKATNHIIYGYPIALLSGDGLFNSAYEIMLNGYFSAEDKNSYMKACAEISKAAGVRGMIGGQVADMLNENVEPDKDILEFIHTNKTGALLKASVLAGALCGRANESELKALSTYGENIGLMFQIVDDILDVIGDEKTMGKKSGADQMHKKMTYPYVYGLKSSIKKVDELYEESIIALESINDETNFLHDLSFYLKARKK